MKHFTLNALGALLVVFSFTACEKDRGAEVVKKDGDGLLDVPWPNVANGILEFSDGQHLQDYLDYLDQITRDSIIIPPADTFTYDPNEKLAWVESNLAGFASLRAAAQAEFDMLNNEGWQHLSDIPEVHYIQDIAMRSVLNRGRQVIVGPKKYKYINDNYGVSIEVDAPDELHQAFEGLPETATTADIYEQLMNLDLHGQVGIFAFNTGAGHDPVLKVASTTFYGFHITEPIVKFPDACGNPKRLRLENLILNEIAGNGQTFQNKAYYTINWGDGQTSTVTSSTGLNSSIVPSVEHIYASYGDYTIHIEATSIDPTFSGTTVVAELDIPNVHIGPRNCLFGYGKAIHNAHWKNSHGVAWTATCWVEQNKNWVGWQFNRAGACTRIYKWTNSWGNWAWRTREGNPYTYISLARTDDNCNSIGTETKASGHHSSKTAEINISFPSNFGWTSFYSDHQSYHNGQWNNNHQLYLSACN